jgi:integrase
MTHEIQIAQSTFLSTHIKKRISVCGIDVDEDFVKQLLIKHLQETEAKGRPTLSDAFDIYMSENTSAHRRKFKLNANQYFNRFTAIFGDLYLDELKHWHITQYRDKLLAQGLHPNSIRKHNNILNAMINMAFKHLDIDRLSPFRGLKIRGEGENTRPIPPITPEKLEQVKARLVRLNTPASLVGLIQLNTGLRISEPTLARLEDLVLDHEIPHLWIRKNSLTDRKTKASIRAVPLVGISLVAAKELHVRAKRLGSPWLLPQYAKEFGGCACSAILNKNLRPFEFRSHMFRHAFIDRLKARNDIPLPLAESITGHGRGQTDFAVYGSVGYTLAQKLQVIQKIEV